MSAAAPMPSDRLLRVTDVAAIMSCSERGVYALVQKGRIASVRPGTGRRRMVLIERSALDAYIAKCRVPARDEVPQSASAIPARAPERS